MYTILNAPAIPNLTLKTASAMKITLGSSLPSAIRRRLEHIVDQAKKSMNDRFAPNL